MKKSGILYSAFSIQAAWPWLAAICSGLLYAGCFAPFNLTWLCWIALTPLLAAIWFSGAESRRRWLRNLILGYVAACQLVTCSNRGIPRRSWVVVHGCLCERDLSYNSTPVDS